MAGVRSLLEGLPDAAGVYPVSDDAWVEILEPRAVKAHGQVRAVWPPAQGIETEFESGPVFVFGVQDAVVDVQTGAIFDRRDNLIRECFGTNKVMERYRSKTPTPSRQAAHLSPQTLLPLATTRSANFCRWWLDSMTKPFLADHSGRLEQSPLPITAFSKAAFQQEALELLDPVRVVAAPELRFWRADAISSSGVTYGGGQRIGELVVPFASSIVASVRSRGASQRRFSPRIWISRAAARIRRVENEDQVAAALADHGFEILVLEEMSLSDQVEAFAGADVVAAPHGAGLTNLLWTRPGATLLEIFPEGGVHGSAFLRLAARIGIDYFAFVGDVRENRDKTGNPNNADIWIDLAAFVPFLKQALIK